VRPRMKIAGVPSGLEEGRNLSCAQRVQVHGGNKSSCKPNDSWLSDLLMVELLPIKMGCGVNRSKLKSSTMVSEELRGSKTSNTQPCPFVNGLSGSKPLSASDHREIESEFGGLSVFVSLDVICS